jgi:GTPase SAR1 family protein
MNFILEQITRKINFHESSGNKEQLKLYYQLRLEFILTLMLSYLWNRNFEQLDEDSKEYVIKRILRPSIGDIEEICRKLDINREIFKKKSINITLQKYPKIRNEKIGHGYVFEDSIDDFLKALSNIYNDVIDAEIPLLNTKIDLIKVTGIEDGFCKGISYKDDGINYMPWNCADATCNFELSSLYGYSGRYSYFRLSPFIELVDESELYIFTSIQEKLLGQVKYNRILKSGNYYKEWPELCKLDIQSDSHKRKSSNGTIINVYQNNFKRYIDIGYKRKFNNFILENNYSVAITIWGHGGVGKTATIQSLIEDFSNYDKRVFQYIIFLTAKDRYYDYLTGEIKELNQRVDSLENIIESVNMILFNENSISLESITNFKGKMLLVIDDFETFPKTEQEKTIDFIRKLNINHHKVIITTRANINIGDEIKTNELVESETIKFLFEILEHDISASLNPEYFIKKLESPSYKKVIHEITTGRPLFIFQLAYLLLQNRNIENILDFDIKKSSSAVEFLYGRIYDYLSETARDLFVSMSLLVKVDDLANLTDKLIFILNMENQLDKFKSALDELAKLKIVETKENGFFYVYSPEILQIMDNMFHKRADSFKGACIRRLNQVTRDKKLDVEKALLQNANNNRISKNEEEVISSYKHILNRTSSPLDIKLQTIINLSSYLYIDRGKREQAIKMLEEYSYNFNRYGIYVKMLANYLWSEGSKTSKAKAIKVLLEFYLDNRNLNLDINLELFGLLLTYRSLYHIDEKEDLKLKLKFNEISSSTFSKSNILLKKEFQEIYSKQGLVLYSYVGNIDINQISAGARQNIITGLYQFAEICLRIEKHEKAIEICQYSLKSFPRNFHQQFEIKIKKINSFLSKNKTFKDSPPTEFAQKLSDALIHKRED